MKKRNCSSCLKIRQIKFFNKDSSRRDGFSYICRKCDNLKTRKYRLSNLDKEYKRSRLYKSLNKFTIRNKQKIYMRSKRKLDLNFKLSGNLRNRLSGAIKNNYKKGSAIKDLGCSIKELKIYLRRKFKKGMNWRNYGKKWEIDHIKPLSKFNLKFRSEIVKACHYTNLQPLFVTDNRRKSNK